MKRTADNKINNLIRDSGYKQLTKNWIVSFSRMLMKKWYLEIKRYIFKCQSWIFLQNFLHKSVLKVVKDYLKSISSYEGSLELYVFGSGEDYISLSHPLLYIKAKIIQPDGKASVLVALINN